MTCVDYTLQVQAVVLGAARRNQVMRGNSMSPHTRGRAGMTKARWSVSSTGRVLAGISINDLLQTAATTSCKKRAGDASMKAAVIHRDMPYEKPRAQLFVRKRTFENVQILLIESPKCFAYRSKL